MVRLSLSTGAAAADTSSTTARDALTPRPRAAHPPAENSPVGSKLPLITGIAAATALSGAAVLAVAHSGCQDPGAYRSRDDGVVELIGGCLQPDDLPITPQPRSELQRRPL